MIDVSLEALDWKRLLEAATKGPPLGVGEGDKRIAAALQAAIPSPSPSKVTIERTPDKTGIEVTGLPPNTLADFARMKDMQATGIVYEPKGKKVGDIVPGTAQLPVLDAQAVDASGHPVPPPPANPWAGRVSTTPATSVPPPPPLPPASGTIFGINSGGEPTDLIACRTLGAKVVRIEVGASHVAGAAAEVDVYRRAGIGVDLILGFSGSMISAEQVKQAAQFAHEHQDVIRALELGNETGYGYQYGDRATAASYKQRARTYATRAAELGALLAATEVDLWAQADDGGSGASVWVDEMFAQVPDLSRYVDKWVNHSYGMGGVAKLERTIKFLANHGDHSTPFALTEDGISTDDGRPLSNNYGYPTNATYATAASLFDAHVASIRRVAGVRFGAFMYYQVRDQKKPGESSNREAYFGALRRDGTPKGAMTAAVESLLAVPS